MEIILIIVIGVTGTTLGCVWMGISYAKKVNGLEKGASEREIEALQAQVGHIHEEMTALKKQVKRLVKVAKGIDIDK